MFGRRKKAAAPENSAAAQPATTFLGTLRSEFDEPDLLPAGFQQLLDNVVEILDRYRAGDLNRRQTAELLQTQRALDLSGGEWTVGADTLGWFRRQSGSAWTAVPAPSNSIGEPRPGHWSAPIAWPAVPATAAVAASATAGNRTDQNTGGDATYIFDPFAASAPAFTEDDDYTPSYAAVSNPDPAQEPDPLVEPVPAPEPQDTGYAATFDAGLTGLLNGDTPAFTSPEISDDSAPAPRHVTGYWSDEAPSARAHTDTYLDAGEGYLTTDDTSAPEPAEDDGTGTGPAAPADDDEFGAWDPDDFFKNL
jgi:hypothetical protein